MMDVTAKLLSIDEALQRTGKKAAALKSNWSGQMSAVGIPRLLLPALV